MTELKVRNGLSVGEGLDASAKLQVNTTTQGSIPAPKMTGAERDAIGTPVEGLLVFNTTTNTLDQYTGSVWEAVGSVSDGIGNVVEDTTPQLGGDLDCQTFDIDVGVGQFIFFDDNLDTYIRAAADDLLDIYTGGGRVLRFATTGCTVSTDLLPATNTDLGADTSEWKNLWVELISHNDVTNPDLNISTTGNNGDLLLSAHGTGVVSVTDTNLTLKNTGTANELRFYEPSGSGTNYTGFIQPATGQSRTYQLPTDVPTNGQILSWGTGELLSWIDDDNGITVSGTDNRLVRMNGTTALQDSGIGISDTDVVTGVLRIETGNGTLSNPAIAPSADPDTGLYFSTGLAGLISGGDVVFTVQGSAVNTHGAHLSLKSAISGLGNTVASELRLYEALTYGSNWTGFKAPEMAVGLPVVYTLPDDSGTALQVLSWNTGDVLTWETAAGGGATTELDNLGTVAINTSLISDTNRTDNLGSATIAWSNLYVDSILFDGSTSGDLTVTAPATITSYTVTLPSAQGGAGTYIKNDGAGNLSWDTPAGAGDVTAAAIMTATSIVVGDDGAKGVKDTGILIDGSDNVSAMGTLGVGAVTVGSGVLTIPNGTEGTPSLRFADNATTGMFYTTGTNSSINFIVNDTGTSYDGLFTMSENGAFYSEARRANDTFGAEWALRARGSSGGGTTAAAPSGKQNLFYFQNWNGAGWNTSAQFYEEATEAQSAGNAGSKFVFKTCANTTSTLTERLAIDSTGIKIGTTYTLPLTDGTNTQYLATNGSGTVTWTTPAGLANIVEDVSPQLGADLDTNGFDINIDSTKLISFDADFDTYITSSADDILKIYTGGVRAMEFGVTADSDTGTYDCIVSNQGLTYLDNRDTSLRVERKFSGAGQESGLIVVSEVQSGSTGNNLTLQAAAEDLAGRSTTLAYQVGVFGEAFQRGTGTITNFEALRFANYTSGAGNVTNQNGVNVYVSNTQAGTHTNVNGLYVRSGFTAGTTTNLKGLYLAAPSASTGVTNKWGVYEDYSGVNYWASQHTSALGTAALPAYSFIADANTGMWSSTADTINFSTAGVERLEIDATSINSTVPIQVPAGTVSAPGLAIGASNTGLYTSGAQIAFSSAGTLAFHFDSSWIYSDNNHAFQSGSAAQPALVFVSDSDTGIWNSTANTLNISTGGVERFEIDSSEMTVTVPISTTSTTESTTSTTGALLSSGGISAVKNIVSGGQIGSAELAGGNKTGSFAIDMNSGNAQTFTRTGNITISALNNPIAGFAYIFLLKQNGTGGYTTTWTPTIKWESGGTEPTWTTTASKMDIVTLTYMDGTWFGSAALNMGT